MKLSTELIHFQGRLGYHFDDVEFLIEAITHPSASSPTRRDNQRLEFLGDRVLGLIVADALLEAYKNASEGMLAPRYNSLVRKECCAEVAQEIGLGIVLKLGRSEMLSGGRRKTALLGDAIESIIAAVFLDGGFENAKKVVLKLWESRIKNAKLLLAVDSVKTVKFTGKILKQNYKNGHKVSDIPLLFIRLLSGVVQIMNQPFK